MEIPYILKLIGIFGILFAVVPLTGFAVTGNLRKAWEYTTDWLRVIGFMVLAGCVLSLVLWPFMPLLR